MMLINQHDSSFTNKKLPSFWRNAFPNQVVVNEPPIRGHTFFMGITKHLEKDLIGKTFNYLTILREVDKKGYVRYMEARCVCGVIKNYPLQVILRGDSQSCGCKMVELRRPSVIKHGLSGHPLNAIHYSIKARCYNKNSSCYKDYGAKGVRMCKEWRKDFMPFYNWCMENGWKDGMQIDKDIKYKEKHGTKIGKLYSPEYCSIVTPKENSGDRSNTVLITFKGETKSAVLWAEQYKISYNILFQRIRRGWDTERSLTMPADRTSEEYKSKMKKWL